MSTNKLWRFTSLLSIIGIGLAAYLFYSYLAPVPPGACYINQTINCGPVTKGSLAEIFGIPVALIGLIGYSTILISSIIKHKKLLLGMTAFGMVFCLRLTYLEIFVEKVICPVCIACQIIMLLTFTAAVILNSKKRDSLKKDSMNG